MAKMYSTYLGGWEKERKYGNQSVLWGGKGRELAQNVVCGKKK